MSDERRHECTHGLYGWITDLDLPTPFPTPTGRLPPLLVLRGWRWRHRHTGLGRGVPIDSNRSRRVRFSSSALTPGRRFDPGPNRPFNQARSYAARNQLSTSSSTSPGVARFTLCVHMALPASRRSVVGSPLSWMPS